MLPHPNSSLTRGSPTGQTVFCVCPIRVGSCLVIRCVVCVLCSENQNLDLYTVGATILWQLIWCRNDVRIQRSWGDTSCTSQYFLFWRIRLRSIYYWISSWTLRGCLEILGQSLNLGSVVLSLSDRYERTWGYVGSVCLSTVQGSKGLVFEANSKSGELFWYRVSILSEIPNSPGFQNFYMPGF